MKYSRLGAPLLAIAIFLVIWHGVARSGLVDPSLFPTPYEVALALGELALSGALLEHVLSSLLRVVVGYCLAVCLAIPAGLVVGWYPVLWTALDPLIQILRTISPIAWIPLAILWFGIGDAPAVFIIAITTFFPVMLSCMHAVRNLDPLLVKVARNLGANDWQVLTKVVLPGTFPYVLIGLRVALGVSWVIIVAAEMVGMRSGLGYLILDARNFLRTDMIMAGMLVIGLIGLALDQAMNVLEHRLLAHRVPGHSLPAANK